jgi:hypothetical protein
MKRRTAVLLSLIIAAAVSADTTRVVSISLLNLISLNKKQLTGYTLHCSLPADTLNRYDFIYHYYEGCTCICPCCPMVTLSSPRPFYVSKAPMNYTQFNAAALNQQFTRITGSDMGSYFPSCTIPSATFGGPGSSKPLDTLRSRLFVFLSDNGGTWPYYVYMLVHIDTLRPRMSWCNPNDPLPGGQYYSLMDTARISTYFGPIAQVKPGREIRKTAQVPADLTVHTIFGKRIDSRRTGELPAGIYIVNGRLRFITRNTPAYKLMRSLQ